MPEGHTIHRYARIQRELLGGRTVAAWSPQGRFAAGARAIDGTTLTTVDAYGKHLFYRFTARDGTPAGTESRAVSSVHVHLGLFGRFRAYRSDPQPPTAGTRLLLAADDVQLHLSGPTTCELMDPAAEALLRARLGPDPLNDDDPGPAFAALQRRSVGIGQALLDQRVIAGIGNVYRAEILFLMGIHPHRPARAIERAAFDAMWKLLQGLLRDGERDDRITTVEPQDRDRPVSSPHLEDRVYVYTRAGLPCRRCGTPIQSWELAGRTVYACPRCQPA